MLDSLSYWDPCTSAVGRAWLNQVLQRHDIARVLEPLLLLLLHPKTHRVSIQRVQSQHHLTHGFPETHEQEPSQPIYNRDSGFSDSELQATIFLTLCTNKYLITLCPSILVFSLDFRQIHGVCKATQELPGLQMGDMEPFCLTVNPLSDSLSVLSLSSENLQLAGEYQPANQQGELQSCDSSGSRSSTLENGSFEEAEGGLDPQPGCTDDVSEDSIEEAVSALMKEVIDRVLSLIDEGPLDVSPPSEVWPQTDTDSTSSDTSTGVRLDSEPPLIPNHQTLPEMLAEGTLELLSVTPVDMATGEQHKESITRHSSSPSIVTLPNGTDSANSDHLVVDDPQARKRSHSSTQLSLKGKIMERLADRSPGTKPKIKKAKRKEEERQRKMANQAEKLRPPSIFFGDSLDLENWYSCGEGEVSEIESDIGSPVGGTSGGGVRMAGRRSSSAPHRFNIHPLYQHVLLYLQLYDSSRALHALSAIVAILRAAPSGFVSAISTTSINNTYTPQLSLLQNLLARHRVSVMGKDFYCPIPQDSHSHTFRSAMYLEIIISLCLYFLRSYYSAHVAAGPQDLAGNRAMQLTSVEVLTLLFSELAKVTGGSAKGFASFISDVLSKCKVQKVVLHCLLSSIFSAQKWHDQRLAAVNMASVEEGLSEDSIINLSEDQIDSCSAVQSQLLRLLQSLVVLEHRVLGPADEGGDGGPVTGVAGGERAGSGAGAGFEFLGGEVEHVNPQQPMTSLQYLHGQPITAQGMFLCAVIRALHQHHACKMHPQWIGLITATLPYMGKVLRRVVASVTLQLCRNLDNLLQQYRYETGITDKRYQHKFHQRGNLI